MRLDERIESSGRHPLRATSWDSIPKGHELQAYAVDVICRWIERQSQDEAS